MIGTFDYKDVNSKVHGVHFKSLKRPLMAPLKRRTTEKTDASGSYDYGGSEYENTTIEMGIAFDVKDISEKWERAEEIAEWLDSETWEKLILGDRPDRYYLARVNGSIDFDGLITSGQTEISFICQPFTYAVSYVPYNFATLVDDVFVFNNRGTRLINYKSPQGSNFDIVISGSFTTLTLSLNGKTINYNEAVTEGVLTINNFDMEIDLDGVNKLGVVTGDLATFFEALPGDNSLSVSGTDLDIGVIVDFRPMWI